MTSLNFFFWRGFHQLFCLFTESAELLSSLIQDKSRVWPKEANPALVLAIQNVAKGAPANRTALVIAASSSQVHLHLSALCPGESQSCPSHLQPCLWARAFCMLRASPFRPKGGSCDGAEKQRWCRLLGKGLLLPSLLLDWHWIDVRRSSPLDYWPFDNRTVRNSVAGYD